MVGCALTFGCFGQLLPQDNSDMLFYSAYYNSIDNRFEHLVHIYPERTTSGDHFKESALARTYLAAVDIQMDMESWKTTPFESSMYEQEVMLESWMLSPFESSFYEPDIAIESWMTAPFEFEREFEDEIEIESWMTTPWV